MLNTRISRYSICDVVRTLNRDDPPEVLAFASRLTGLYGKELRQLMAKAKKGDETAVPEGMKVAHVTASPYATQEGELFIPKGLSESEEHKYISSRFGDIPFGDPELDYCGTDFEYYCDEEE